MNIWRPYTQMQLSTGTEFVEHAQGSYLHLRNGRKILDGISSWWLITHGHCHPEVSRAIATQSQHLDQVVFANFTHEPAQELVEELKSLLPPTLNTIFFSDNGSTAVEVAMKMAYQYCQLRGHVSKRVFCAFSESYHGDTVGAMSVTGDGLFTNPYPDLRLRVIRCSQGAISTDPVETWIANLREQLEKNHEKIAAVILEPRIQGAGGMIVWPEEAVRKILSICRAHDVLVIFDEVMTGFGRTGKLFAFEHTLPELPDFVCLSKGLTAGSLPLAVTLTHQKIYDAFLSDDISKTFFHGHSFTANSISCAAAAASLRIFRTEPVLMRVKQIEDAHRSAISKIQKRFELRDSRVCGSIGAIELNTDFGRDTKYASGENRLFFNRCLERGLFLRPLGRVIYLMPPYSTNAAEVTWAWETIETCLDLSND